MVTYLRIILKLLIPAIYINDSIFLLIDLQENRFECIISIVSIISHPARYTITMEQQNSTQELNPEPHFNYIAV